MRILAGGNPGVIGNDTTVGHKVMLHACTVGNNCLISIKAILLDGCEIGDNCLIGAGTLVKQNQKIPGGSLAAGAPARVIRKLTSDEMADIQGYANRYVALQDRYSGGALHPL